MQPDETGKGEERKLRKAANSKRGMKRRDLLKGVVAAGLTGAIGATAEVEAAAQISDAITTADLAVADKLAGRAYTEADHALMLRRVTSHRDVAKALRQVDLSGGEPATHFEPRLPGMRLPQGKSGVRLSRGRPPAYTGPPESLAFATVVDLARLLRARKISSTALTRMYLERLKKFGPRLRCVVTLTEDLALQQADRADREIAAGDVRGPLHGIPWGAKDLFATRGIRTTFGAKPYEEQILDYDATVVQRLEAAGAVLVAKLSMGELAMGDVWFGGLTRNPWKPDKGSSGSSAGPGSATAAGLVGFAIGTETLGSIVSPSVVNGVTGLRPTYGRVSRYGAMALCWTMDKIGPMCRGVEDCALVLSAIFGPDGKDGTVADAPFVWDPASKLSALRVGIDKAAFASVQRSETRSKVYGDLLDTLGKLGIQPIPVTLPNQTPAYRALAELIIDVESAASFAELTLSGRVAELAQQGEGNWPNTFRVGSTVPAVDYLQALRVRTRLQQEMAELFRSVDLYITVPFAGPSLAYTNLTGHPALVTRCGMLDGVPQSIEFIGGLYQEAAILRVAFAYERATPWHTQWPDSEKIPPEQKASS